MAESKKTTPGQAPGQKPQRKDAPPARVPGADFRYVRLAVFGFAAALLLGVLMVLGTQKILDGAEADARQQEQRRAAARGELTRAEADQRDLALYRAGFEALARSGFVGKEARLDWIEKIRAIQQARHLLPISFEIMAQQPVALDPALGDESYELRASRMQLSMNMLHELDFLNFMQDLRHSALFTVESCRLQPLENPANELLAPRMSAECTLVWPTFGAVVDDAAP